MKIFVFGNQEKKQLVVSAVFDNLGKGASGQAIQCLNIMLDTEVWRGYKSIIFCSKFPAFS